MEYITEAFKSLNILDEDVFDVSSDGIEKAKEFMDADAQEVETVIDPLAETEEELQDSYIGKVILDCTICQSKLYKDPTEVVINEEAGLANIGEICPYCQSSDGYKVIGQVGEYKPEDEIKVSVEDKVKETEETEEGEDLDLDEALNLKEENKKLDDVDADADDKKEKAKTDFMKAKDDADADRDEKLKEDLQKVELETEDQKIKVETEPKEATGEEAIVPVEPETETEFKVETEDEEDETPEEDDYQDVDIDEFDENEFDELGEKYLRRVYENVKSFKTTSGSTKGNQIKLEGLITFKSGKQVKTNFIFEAKTITKSGKVKFSGLNEQFAKGKNAFILTGNVNNKKLIAESLTYNYHGKDSATSKSSRIYGTVKCRRK